MAHLLIGDVLDNLVATVPDRPAAAIGDEAVTFGELGGAGRRSARALAALGVGPGDRVVHWGGPSLDTLAVFAGLAWLGGVFAPLSSVLSVDEAAGVAGTVRPALLVVGDDRLAVGRDLADRLDVPLACTGGLLRPAAGDPSVLAAGGGDDGRTVVRLAQLAGGGSAGPLPRPAIGEDDPHVIFFTSGSTGRAKGVVLSHRVSVLRSHPGALLEPRGAAVIPYPLFHMAAWTQALQQWHARDLAVFTTADAPAICAAVERHRATRVNAIPAVWRRILDHLATPDGRVRDLGSLRFADSGTSATPPDLIEAIAAALPGAWIRIFYGATETGAATMLEHPDVRRKPGSVGQAAPLAEVRLAAGGELQVRGPLVFGSYFGDEAATAEAFDGDWYRTGDLAEVDDEGFVRIVGRAGELIRTGGEAVTPAEVEAVVAAHPGVAEVAVVGVPDPTWGEVVVAAIVPADGAGPPSLAEVTELCAPRLARFKHPRRLVVVDELPRTPATGQVRRRELAELAARRAAPD